MIPIGPDFQDPVASPNYPPFLHDETPIAGSAFTVADDLTQEVKVFATDLNAGDKLYYEWVLDYPPYVKETTKVLPPQTLPAPASGPQTQMIALTVRCDLGWVFSGPAQRHLQIILSDRPLSGNLDAQESFPGDPIARQTWNVILSCTP